jgi:hypothetical protein
MVAGATRRAAVARGTGRLRRRDRLGLRLRERLNIRQRDPATQHGQRRMAALRRLGMPFSRCDFTGDGIGARPSPPLRMAATGAPRGARGRILAPITSRTTLSSPETHTAAACTRSRAVVRRGWTDNVSDVEATHTKNHGRRHDAAGFHAHSRFPDAASVPCVGCSARCGRTRSGLASTVTVAAASGWLDRHSVVDADNARSGPARLDVA